jgi:hypothetical protein
LKARCLAHCPKDGHICTSPHEDPRWPTKIHAHNHGNESHVWHGKRDLFIFTSKVDVTVRAYAQEKKLALEEREALR